MLSKSNTAMYSRFIVSHRMLGRYSAHAGEAAPAGAPGHFFTAAEGWPLYTRVRQPLTRRLNLFHIRCAM